MKTVVLEKINFTLQQKSRLQNLGEVEFYDHSTLPECRKRVKNTDVVVIDWIEPNDFLEDMKPGSLLALMSTGYGWVDVVEARKLNISVANIPGYATEAVAEHLVGLILAVARKFLLGGGAVRTNNWQQGDLQGIELKDRTLGVIGLGRIGSRIAEICKGFGMKVITYNRKTRNRKDIKDVDLDTLLKTSDIISINCDLNETTKGMLNKEKLDLIKKEAILVGATWDIIDIKALTKKLKNKEIYGAGFDVAIEGGKPDLPKEFLELENVVLTPHIAFNTQESKIRQVDICIDNIEAFLGNKPQNIVN